MKDMLQRLAIKTAMQRPAPSRIPLSGRERLRQRNYVSVHLESSSGFPLFLVQSIEKDGYVGLSFKDRYSTPTQKALNLSEANALKTRFTYYYDELELVYSSSIRFLIAFYLRTPFFILLKERAIRWIFNRRPLIRGDSLQVLRHMLERTYDSADYRCSPERLMSEFNTNRWINHPGFIQARQHYDLVLQALEANGDIGSNDGWYFIKPQALSRIEQFDQEDQKFRMGHSLQRRISWLTLALLLAAAVQAYSAFKGIPSE